MHIPVPLPPSFPGLDVTVSFVESLRPDRPVPLATGGAFLGYCERIEGGAQIVERTEAGDPAMMASGPVTYLAGWPDGEAWARILARICEAESIETIELPENVRRRDTATERFWFNYGDAEQRVHGRQLPPAGVLREARPRTPRSA
jgi:beta-galactosidase